MTLSAAQYQFVYGSTASVLAGGIGVWLSLGASGTDFAPATAGVVFIGLSALTAPHMLASALYEGET